MEIVIMFIIALVITFGHNEIKKNTNNAPKPIRDYNNDNTFNNNILEQKKDLITTKKISEGKENLVKVFSDILIYSCININDCDAFNILEIYRDLKAEKININKYTDCMISIFDFKIDFNSINIRHLREKLLDNTYKYFIELGNINFQYTYNEDKFKYIEEESLNILYSKWYKNNALNNTNYFNIKYYNLYSDDFQDNILNSENDKMYELAKEDYTIIKFVIQTIEVIINSYKLLKYFDDNSDFNKVIKKLNENNVYYDVIEEKISDIFGEKINEDFFNINTQLDFKINKVNFLIKMYDTYNEIDDNYNLFIDKFKNSLIENDITRNMDLKKYITNFLINYIDIDDSDSELEKKPFLLMHFLLNNNLVNYNTINKFLIEYDDCIETSSKYLRNNHSKNEINRILCGNLENEISLSNGYYELSKITNGYEFEQFIGNLYKKLNYKVKVTKKSGDQGADIIIEKDNIKSVIQTKFYTQPVGNKAIQEIVAAIPYYQAKYGVVVTNNMFTKSAIELAQKNNVKLIDGQNLNDLITSVFKN